MNTTTHTAAEIADIFNNDGTCFDTEVDGVEMNLDLVCRERGTETYPKYEHTLYTFPDGSAILVASAAWDIALPCGRCWEGVGCRCADAE